SGLKRPSFQYLMTPEGGCPWLRNTFHEALPFDHPLGDIARDVIGRDPHVCRFGEHDPACARIPEKAIGAPVTAHLYMGNRVDPQSGLKSGRDGEVEIVHVRRNVGKYR